MVRRSAFLIRAKKNRTYLVDMEAMTQENITHSYVPQEFVVQLSVLRKCRVRNIRRVKADQSRINPGEQALFSRLSAKKEI